MIDLYLLTAPILLLGIVALLRFVGCGFAPQASASAPNLGAPVIGDRQVTLNWTESDTDTTGYSYQVNRSNDNQPFAVVAKVPATTYTDTSATGLTNGTTYKYTVTATVGNFVDPSSVSNEVKATPAIVPGRPPRSVLDTANPLATNLIGLFLMNEGTETAQGKSAPPDINLVDLAMANPSGNAAPTWEVADPSIVFHGGGSLNSYLDAGVDLLFNNMPTDKITIVAKVLVNALFTGGICEKNDGKPPGSDSGFIFAITNTGALHVKVELSAQSMVLETNGGVVAVGQWMQLAFTWDGTQYNAGTKTAPSAAAAIFVNQKNQAGNLNAMTTHNGTGTLDTTMLSNNQPFRIGNVSYDFASSLYGKIAYMAVYKGRLLTPTDLATLDSGLPIKQA
jgi:hypothetical protein